MRIVAPFRPFKPESDLHRLARHFDWMSAIRMMRASVRAACGCDVQVLTDVDTTLPFPLLQYHTVYRRLMLWYLEICACFLESDDFDQDTVMLDSDQLIYQNLSPWFEDGVDLTVLIRPHLVGLKRADNKDLPILNGVQWWAHAGRARLGDFYRRALVRATELPEDRIVWGADTDALCDLLEPLTVGVHQRSGLTVKMVDSGEVLHAVSAAQMRALQRGAAFTPKKAVIDFRGKRKWFMKDIFEATLGQVPA